MEIKVAFCDACDTRNPPTVEGTRLTTCCANPKGMYNVGIPGKFGIGKVTYRYLQFPIEIRWRGWWDHGFFRNSKKKPVVKKRCPVCKKNMDQTKIERHLRSCRNKH